MRFNPSGIVTLLIGAALAMAGMSLLGQGSHAARAAAEPDTRDQRMREDKWTSGDYSRDALDHLKKAEDEMGRVSKNTDSKVAKDAAKLTSEARAKVDEFIAELDAKEKKK